MIEEDLVEKERKEDEEKEKNTKSVKRNKKRDEQKSANPSQHLPHPHAKSRKDNARQYARFMDIFKQLQVNIPFSEALEQMPKYAKFTKDILTKKKRYSEEETILLDARCSAIIQKTLPKKEADPGRVTLPVTIGGHYIGNGLVDLGSSINLIPLSIIKRLGNIEMKPTQMTLQLADKSLTSPYGVAQDMLVKVDKFLFPVDFVVVDMEEDRDVPLILGRPFMKTAWMMIDIDDGLMKVRVQDEEVTFNLFEAMKHPKDKHHTFRVDATEEEIEEVANQVHISSPLERSLIGAYNALSEIEEKEMEAFLNELESCGEIDHNEEKVEELHAEKKVEESKIELKMLPPHLKYVFLGDNFTKPVIISNSLSTQEETRLIEVLKKHEGAIGWVLSDLKGISPAYCMHKIMMEDDYKPVAQPQRRLNPSMKEVVRKEVVKLLEAVMIYPIFDSEWVIPVQVVPRKGGMTVIRNEKNVLIPTITVTG
ncbi:uncharacterized protein LOC131597169 [Vicia villosa]|uniref:uncharacterized protein LOC131597169 n=1 Tax=Vicia villosa TaxID=3911 RepID=UPI00273BBEF5|nr:uncharacterized protein LOC131597169 [Vicia villosa]